MELTPFLKKQPIPIGSVEDFQVGTKERAYLMSVRLLSYWSDLSTSVHGWEQYIGYAKEENTHKLLGFSSFDKYLATAIGVSARDVRDRWEETKEAAKKKTKLAPHGKRGRGKKKSGEHKEKEFTENNVNSFSKPKSKGGNRKEYIIAKLRRDYPDKIDEGKRLLKKGILKNTQQLKHFCEGKDPYRTLEKIERLLPGLPKSDMITLRDKLTALIDEQ